MNKQQKIIVSIVGITIVLLALLGITYAYYLTRIEGNTNTNSISITTADLKLVYGDGNGLLTATNIMPGKQVEFKTTGNQTTTEKTFTVTNTGNSTIEGYAVSLDYAYIADVMPSIFERPEDFQITLTCSTNKTGETCNGFNGNFNNESIMLTSNSIDENEVHMYSLSIYYNDPNLDQSNDMGKNLNLKVQIYNVNETTDIEGTITGVDSNYFVKLESEPKMSTIVNGKYSFKGIEVGTHTLTVLDEDGNEIDKEYIVVKSGTTPGIATTKATIDNTEVDATGITVTKNERVAKLYTEIDNSNIVINISQSAISLFNPYFGNNNSLAYNILNKALIARDKNSDTESVFKTGIIPYSEEPDESLKGKTYLGVTPDDYGDSYYFFGNTIDNFVNYAGMCWRIVRIEGDGSIKITLASELECREENLNTSSGYATDGAKGNVGNIIKAHYGYKEENGRKYVDYINSQSDNSNSAKVKLNEWLNTKINASDKALLKEDEWCLGDLTNAYHDEEPNKIIGNIEDYKTQNFHFQAGNKYWNYLPATLKCKLDSDYNETTVSYIGLLNYDEIMFSGSYIDSYTYLVHNVQTEFTLTLTPYFHDEEPGYEEDAIFIYFVDSYEEAGMDADYCSTKTPLRPVVTLKSGTLISGGKGTIDSPYQVS